MKETSYYDIIASVYDTIVPRDIKGICDSFEDIIQRYTKSQQIVDLGCGTGRFAIELAKRKYKVYGVDLSEQMLDVARKNAKRSHVRIRFVRADMRELTLPRKAGIIWARGSIGDLLRPSDKRNALLNVRRNLADNALLVFDVRDLNEHFRTYGKSIVRDTRIFKKRKRTVIFRYVIKLDPKTRIARIAGEVSLESKQSPFTLKTSHALRYYTSEQLSKLLAAAGFTLLDIMPGYRLERNPKPRLGVIARRDEKAG